MLFQRSLRIFAPVVLSTLLLGVSASVAQGEPTQERAPVAAPKAALAPVVDVSFTLGTTTIVPLVSAKVSGKYSCRDNLGAHQVHIEVIMHQGNINAMTTVNRPCQVIDGDWTASVLGLFAQNQTIEAEAIAYDGNTKLRATDEADLVKDVDFFAMDPLMQLVSGKTRITGHATCSADSGAFNEIVLSLEQFVNGAIVVGQGVAKVNCTGTSQAFTIDIAPNTPAGQTEATGWSTGDNSGVLNGTQIYAPISVPTNIVGNAIALMGWQ